MTKFALGLDFGTGSVRALLVDLADGVPLAQASAAYAHGHEGVVTDRVDPDLARQFPGDYLAGLRTVVPAALAAARAECEIVEVVGIGVDATGSTPLAVDAQCRPLTEQPVFADDLAAMAWLWKDHTAHAEAAEITALARQRRPQYLARCGGTYSSEWFWAKVLRCQRTAPAVFAAAHSFVELCDFVPGWLTGVRDPGRLPRSVCAAGHKAMYSTDWGGLPDREFLAALAPELAAMRDRMNGEAVTADRCAGNLAPDVAAQLGLPAGIPVAVGALDAHLGAVGAGIAAGDVVKVIGTSTCDMAVSCESAIPEVDGLCGVVRGSILPEAVGFEAGQSAVGDIFAWFAERLGKRDQESLTRDAAELRPGESGLLALDWHNGNRSILADPELSGLVVGLSLHTRDAELYRAMLEATAFGARVIIERLVDSGVPVHRVIACGGIARKNDLLLQIYADVLDRPLQVAASDETCALGAAICGAVAAGHFPDVAAAQARLCPSPTRRFEPRPGAVAVYGELFALYRGLHDAFGTRAPQPLGSVMKDLRAIRVSVRKS